jgi:arylsulfatase
MADATGYEGWDWSALAEGASVQTPPMSSPRPNLLLITTDQQRFDTIAAAASDPGMDARQANLLTPHLDWLATTGIRFTRCYADCPVSAPSRATLMTGRHAWSHGQTKNDGQPSPMSRLPTLPGLLTAAGYQTHAHGKMHFHPARAHYGFEHMEILPDYYRWAKRAGVSPLPKYHGVGENEMEPAVGTAPRDATVTQWVVDRSVDFLETRDPTRPFFLWSSFTKPHPPFDPLPEFHALYRDLSLPSPRAGAWSSGDEPPHAFRGATYHLNNVQRFGTDKLAAARRAYYACVTEVDYALGRLFARLRELGLLETTWIVFTSDHGEMLGDHGMGAKSVFFEGSAHVPLIVRPPSTPWLCDPRGGTTDDRLACLADLLPTLLGAAGVRSPAGTDGLDLLGRRRRRELVGACGPYHCLISGTRKYHFSEEGGDELLFDTATDPYEENNLAGTDLRTKTALRDRLTAHLAGRAHPAVKDGVLSATSPLPDPAKARRAVWPGFHSIDDETCDLLH